MVVFGRGRAQNTSYDLKFKNEIVEVVGEYKYLGVLFNNNRRIRRGQEESVNAATRAMYNPIGKCRKFDFPADLQIDLFRATVLPVMLYSCEVWGHNVIRDLEILCMRYLKYVFCVHRNTCNDIVYWELRVNSIDVDIKVIIVSYWIRLITERQEKLAYVMNVSMFVAPGYCWTIHFFLAQRDQIHIKQVWLVRSVVASGL